jgi:hypothetical protein
MRAAVHACTCGRRVCVCGVRWGRWGRDALTFRATLHHLAVKELLVDLKETVHPLVRAGEVQLPGVTQRQP